MKRVRRAVKYVLLATCACPLVQRALEGPALEESLQWLGVSTARPVQRIITAQRRVDTQRCVQKGCLLKQVQKSVLQHREIFVKFW